MIIVCEPCFVMFVTCLVRQNQRDFRTVPPFVTVNTVCVSQDGPRNFRFARFMIRQEKKILARVIGIQKENTG